MLEHVKARIEDRNKKNAFKSFSAFYTDFVWRMQDVQIASELEYLISYNRLTALSLDKLIAAEMNRKVI